MKKIVLTFFALGLILFSFQTKAQTEKQNIIKVNFLSPVVSTASLFYERSVSESSSVQLGFFYTGASAGDTKLRGFGITPEFRYYLSDKGSPEGFFLAPFLRYQSFDLTVESVDFNTGANTEDKADYTSFGGGLLIGGQWVFKDKISLDVWGGPTYNSGNLEVESGSTEESFEIGGFDGFGFRFGATLGFAF